MFHHHWREGNMASGARCEVCRRACGSSDVLAGMRCEWCGITVSSELCTWVQGERNERNKINEPCERMCDWAWSWGFSSASQCMISTLPLIRAVRFCSLKYLFEERRHHCPWCQANSNLLIHVPTKMRTRSETETERMYVQVMYISHARCIQTVYMCMTLQQHLSAKNY